MEDGEPLPDASAPPPEAAPIDPLVETRQLIQEINGNVKKAQERIKRLGRDDFK